MYELEHEQEYWIVPDTESIVRVLGIFKHRFPCIYYKKLMEISELKNLSTFHGFQRHTTFRVTNEEGRILMGLIQ